MKNSKKPIPIWVKTKGDVKMTRRNKDLKVEFSAKIMFVGVKNKAFYKKQEIENFVKKLEVISDPAGQKDAENLLLCLQVGRLVEVEEEEIKLHFWTKRYKPLFIITENPELISLLEELVQS